MILTTAFAVGLVLSPQQVFTGLVGNCWQTEMPQQSTDTHCFSASEGGKLVMDIHKVRNSDHQIIYEGVTLYRLEADIVTYSYYNSLGDLYLGKATRTDDTIDFAPDLSWKLSSETYEVTSPSGTRHFRRIGLNEVEGL